MVLKNSPVYNGVVKSKTWQYRRPRPRRFDFPRRGTGAKTAGVTQTVIDRKVPAEAQRFCKIVKAWDQIVGPRMAQRSCPALLRRQLLFVDLKDRQWAHDMGYMQKTILARIAAVVGKGQVLCLRCRVQAPGQFLSHAQREHRTEQRRLAWREMAWPTPRPPSLPPSPPAQTKQALDAIEHAGLRESALALRRALSKDDP